MLTVTGTATQVESKVRNAHFGVCFPEGSSENTYRFEKAHPATPGTTIADVRVKGASGQDVSLGNRTEMDLGDKVMGLRDAHGLKLTLSADRQSATLTGELVRSEANKGQRCAAVLPVVLTEQRRVAVDLKPQQVSATLAMPTRGGSSTVSLPLPPLGGHCEKADRKVMLQVLDGNQVVWEDGQLSHSALVTVQGRRCVVTATQVNDQVRVDLLEAPAGLARNLP
jgi:hypothetical protein